MILKSHDLLALLPFFIVVAFALIVVLFDVVHKTKKGRTYLANIASLGMLLGLGAILFIGEKVPAGSAFSGMIYHDHFSLFLNSLFLISGIATVQLSPRYLREHGVERGEFYALVMLATTGMMLMAAGGDLIIVFLGLEVMSVAVYVLVGFFRADARSAESSLKYFFLGAFASAIFLYGMALLYGTTGATSLEGISEALTSSTSLGDQTLVRTGAQGEPAQLEPLFYIGALLLLVGMAFKIALAPFHMWTPDAYSGAPASTAGFMATAVKAAGFAALIRVLFIAFDVEASRLVAQGWVPLFFYLSIITVVIGNLMAIVQTKIKRMLAYSSIAHAGYATIGLVAAGYIGEGEQGQAAFGFVNVDAVLFYLLIYTVATIGAFGVLAYLGSKDKDIETYEDFSGVGYRHPKVGLAMAIFMLSSAGIPPTAGFVAKFAVFQNAIAVGSAADDSSFFWLVVIALLASVAGAFYYLRVIVHMYMKPERKIVPKRESSGAFAVLMLSAIATLAIGVYPKPVLELTTQAMQDFQGADAEPYMATLEEPDYRVPMGQNKVLSEEEEKLKEAPQERRNPSVSKEEFDARRQKALEEAAANNGLDGAVAPRKDKGEEKQDKAKLPIKRPSDLPSKEPNGQGKKVIPKRLVLPKGGH